MPTLTASQPWSVLSPVMRLTTGATGLLWTRTVPSGHLCPPDFFDDAGWDAALCPPLVDGSDPAARAADGPASAIALATASANTPRRILIGSRSEEHTSELQSRGQLVCRLLL